MRRSQTTTDAAFTEFVTSCTPRLYRTALLLTAHRQAAEDLLQATWVKVYVAWRRVRSADDPVAYTYGIMIKTLNSDRRRRSSGELPVEHAPDTPHPFEEPAERLALLAALAQLAPVDRAVVVLRFWEDRSVAQTAAALHLTEAAVKNRSLRALRTLRGLLSDHLTPELRSTP